MAGAVWDAFVDALDVGLDVVEKAVFATGIRPTVVRDVVRVRAWKEIAADLGAWLVFDSEPE